MTIKNEYQAWIIKFSSVLTSTPRWVAALLVSEGFSIPEAWKSWWIIISAFMSVGMAITEALAFAYIFEAWRNQKDKSSNKLLFMAVLSAIVFVGVVAPNVASVVRSVPLSEILSNDIALYIWSVFVAASSIVIVASVGFAQKQNSVKGEVTLNVQKVTEKSSKRTSSWKDLTEEDRKFVYEATVEQVLNMFDVSEKTVYNWKNKLKQDKN